MNATVRRPTSVARFRLAQNRVYPRVLREISAGNKESHWMWFIFPQLRGLAKSDTARYYGIADRAEAVAYMNDPALRARLAECVTGVLRHDRLMFGHPDNHKLRACMTLFAQVAEDATLLNRVLEKFYKGPDPLTLDLLAGKRITLPPSRPAVAAPRRWEQGVLRIPADTEAWSRDRITSFVRSFGLSAVATRQMVDAWLADRGKAMGAVWASMEEKEER